jgi:hypothetical protein
MADIGDGGRRCCRHFVILAGIKEFPLILFVVH